MTTLGMHRRPFQGRYLVNKIGSIGLLATCKIILKCIGPVITKVTLVVWTVTNKSKIAKNWLKVFIFPWIITILHSSPPLKQFIQLIFNTNMRSKWKISSKVLGFAGDILALASWHVFKNNFKDWGRLSICLYPSDSFPAFGNLC